MSGKSKSTKKVAKKQLTDKKPTNNEVKWDFITLMPFSEYTNQFGVLVNSTLWDGTVYAPKVDVQVVGLRPTYTKPALSGISAEIEQYSIAPQLNVVVPQPNVFP